MVDLDTVFVFDVKDASTCNGIPAERTGEIVVKIPP